MKEKRRECQADAKPNRNFFQIKEILSTTETWRLVRRCWDLNVENSSPGRCVYVVFLGKTLFTQCPSPPRSINGNQQTNCFGDNLTKCWD